MVESKLPVNEIRHWRQDQEKQKANCRQSDQPEKAVNPLKLECQIDFCSCLPNHQEQDADN